MSRTTQPRPSRHAVRTAAAAVGTALLLAGCSSGGTTPVAAAPSSAPASTAASSRTATPTPSSSPTPTSTARGPLAIGTPVPWSGTRDGEHASGNATVTAYQQDVAHDAPPPEKSYGASSHGFVWASLSVRVCSDAGSTLPVTVSTTRWTLAYDDGSVVEASNVGYSQYPKPEFPAGDTTLTAGRCIAGAIVYPVPGDKRPARAVYSPASMPTPAEWAIPTQ